MPGSFDPFTIGHLDILRRSLALFDRVIVCVGINSAKTSAAETEERVESIRRIIVDTPGAEVMAWDGLTVDAARKTGAIAMVRGVRSATDYEYERNLADLNRRISGIETVLLTSLPELSAISSSAVRELSRYGHDITQFLP